MSSVEDALEIPLDGLLQLWVLLPITVATLLMGLLRRNLTTLALREPPTNLVKTADAHTLARSANLRRSAPLLSRVQFELRRRHFTRPGGLLSKAKVERSATVSTFMNPESLANQVTALVLSVLPQMALGTWARYSFAGLAVCRLPFALTPRFRPMLQSGIEMAGQSLDVSYVSSLSWYILNLFGNAGLLMLMSDGPDEDFIVPSVASQIALTVTPDQVFATERDSLTKYTYRCDLEKEEEAILKLDPAVFSMS